MSTPCPPAPAASPADAAASFSAEELSTMRWVMSEKAQAFTELNRRIARLCHALGVVLKDEEDLRRILAREAEGFQACDAANESLRSAVGGPAQHREHLEREELRGLLAMRCDLLTQTLDEFGLEGTQTITAMAESELEQEGFSRGADGFTLLKQLNAPREPRQIS